jgi:hypothetical protein
MVSLQKKTIEQQKMAAVSPITWADWQKIKMGAEFTLENRILEGISTSYITFSQDGRVVYTPGLHNQTITIALQENPQQFTFVPILGNVPYVLTKGNGYVIGITEDSKIVIIPTSPMVRVDNTTFTHDTIMRKNTEDSPTQHHKIALAKVGGFYKITETEESTNPAHAAAAHVYPTLTSVENIYPVHETEHARIPEGLRKHVVPNSTIPSFPGSPRRSSSYTPSSRPTASPHEQEYCKDELQSIEPPYVMEPEIPKICPDDRSGELCPVEAKFFLHPLCSNAMTFISEQDVMKHLSRINHR